MLAETLYLYYKVPLASQAAVLPSVQAMQLAVARETGCRIELACRCDDPETWMEIYASYADAGLVLSAIARHFDASGLASLLPAHTVRHVERFRTLTPR